MCVFVDVTFGIRGDMPSDYGGLIDWQRLQSERSWPNCAWSDSETSRHISGHQLRNISPEICCHVSLLGDVCVNTERGLAWIQFEMLRRVDVSVKHGKHVFSFKQSNKNVWP
jgi:hypothetical protein